jgi:hypothetical protein
MLGLHMSFFDKVKESLVNRVAELLIASFTALLLWAAYQVSPEIIPAIESVSSKKVLLALLVASFTLNIILLLVVWSTSKKDSFRLKYGIYWDIKKNPHCPSCKAPLAAYGAYQIGGVGYRCIPCKKVFPLTDASGKEIEPAQALREL